MAIARELPESPVIQGPLEKVAYNVTTPAGRSPASVVVTIWLIDDQDNPVDKTATCATGSASVASTVITTPLLQNLVSGSTYRVDVKYTDSGNTWYPYFRIYCR